MIPMRDTARVIAPTRRAPESRGISQEDLPIHAGTNTDSEMRMAVERKSPSTSLPSREEATIVKPSSARVIATGATRLLN